MRSTTLWSQGAALDKVMMEYTIAEDRVTDARLLPWDVIGSLGHIEGLHRSGLLSAKDYRSLRAGLRAALQAITNGDLVIAEEHEDGHTAIEAWLTAHRGEAGERVHTGRSRNDQVACALRLYLKDTLLTLHARSLDLGGVLLAFASKHHKAIWPGFTHTRRAMPSSAGIWGSALAEGILTTAQAVRGVWTRLDRSPLGSGAGYGVALPLEREVAMRALGFGELDHSVGTTQLTRGKLEAAVMFWCSDMAHDLSRLATDVISYSSSEYGLLVLPPDLATGSSIMPHKRNPDLFELTRARAAEVDGLLGTMLHLKGKLTGGYHRDFQLFKDPLFRALDRTEEMLSMLLHAVPNLGLDARRGRALLGSDLLATDEVMSRVESGVPFRSAYRQVAVELASGATFPVPPMAELIGRRTSTGGMGNLALSVLRGRARDERRWNRKERGRFEGAIARVCGRTVPR